MLPVPEEHLPRIYAFLAGLDSDTAATVPTESAPPLTADLIARMYRESESRHRQLLTYLAASPHTWFHTGELADALDVPTGRKGMAGVFGAFGRRAKHRYGGAKPWDIDWDPEREEVKYLVSGEVAAWVKAAAGSVDD
jgi:hypothetical protein